MIYGPFLTFITLACWQSSYFLNFQHLPPDPIQHLSSKLSLSLTVPIHMSSPSGAQRDNVWINMSQVNSRFEEKEKSVCSFDAKYYCY